MTKLCIPVSIFWDSLLKHYKVIIPLIHRICWPHNENRGCTPNLVNTRCMAEFLQGPRPSSLAKPFSRSFCNLKAQQESHLRKDCPNLNTKSMNGTCSDHVSYVYTTKAAGTGMEIDATSSHTRSLKGIVCSQALSLWTSATKLRIKLHNQRSAEKPIKKESHLWSRLRDLSALGSIDLTCSPSFLKRRRDNWSEHHHSLLLTLMRTKLRAKQYRLEPKGIKAWIPWDDQPCNSRKKKPEKQNS